MFTVLGSIVSAPPMLMTLRGPKPVSMFMYVDVHVRTCLVVFRVIGSHRLVLMLFACFAWRLERCQPKVWKGETRPHFWSMMFNKNYEAVTIT